MVRFGVTIKSNIYQRWHGVTKFESGFCGLVGILSLALSACGATQSSYSPITGSLKIDPTSTIQLANANLSANAACGVLSLVVSSFGTGAGPQSTLLINVLQSFSPVVGDYYLLAPYQVPTGLTCVAGQAQGGDLVFDVSGKACAYDIDITGYNLENQTSSTAIPDALSSANISFSSFNANGFGNVAFSFQIAFTDRKTFKGSGNVKPPPPSTATCEEGPMAE